MLILKLATRNLARHPRKTVLLGTLIATGMAALFLANAVFESTNSGLKASFVGSLTGDAAVSAKSDMAFSLFGSEIPIVSEYESIPPIPSYADTAKVVADLKEASAWTPLVCGLAQVRVAGYVANVPLFGVAPETYFKVCSDIEIREGDTAALADGGVFFNSTLYATIESAAGRPLKVGEDVVFGMYSGGGFRLKKGKFAGVHGYVGSSDALVRVVLADAMLVRSIANYTLGYARPDAPPAEEDPEAGFDLDGLFAAAEDVEAPAEAGITLQSVELAMSDVGERDALVKTDAAAWSFVLIRAKEGRERALAEELAGAIGDAGLDCRAMGWRAAAGTSAQALVAVQAAFYAGLGFVALGAVLVIMNAFVISVLERSAEIGTMRSLGAGSRFIRRLFIAESMILTMSSALVGVMIGAAASFALSKAGIRVSNPLLVTLFGGEVVRPLATVGAVFSHLTLALAIGASAWIYPVSLAMKVQPVTAMNG